MSKEIGDYYLGLDIGTNSVGWAVTDLDYNILEFRRKATWGIHLFSEGETAKDRRLHRIARRRLNRRKQRITLLRELFSEEICKVDPNFFERLDDSGLFAEDKRINQRNSLFNDSDFNDGTYHKKFPTIYHLRRYLMDTDEKPDIRLVYLACHHIIKYRGHFLFKTDTSDKDPDFSEILMAFIDSLRYRDIELSISDPDKLRCILSDRTIGVKDRKKGILPLLICEDESPDDIAGLLAGSTIDLGKFIDESLKNEKISFKESNADDELAKLEGIMDPEDMRILRIAKQLYDWGVLSSILSGHGSISEVKIAEYNQHKEDLGILKSAVRQYVPGKYNEIFKAGDIKGNYSSYAYVFGKKKPKKSCSQKEFCDYVRKTLKDTGVKDDERFTDMMVRLENHTFMPKQTSRNNSILPYTVHRKELIAILNNAAKHYQFLAETDDAGFSTLEKIKMIQEFRIPYYVGPLDTRSANGWAVRKTFDHVTPWNVDKIVDLEDSAEKFMDRLTNYCTYMVGEKVLPKNSILYSYYTLYNEINKMRINGDLIPTSLKKKLVEDLFYKKDGRVTKKKILDYLKAEGIVDPSEKTEITGVDDQIKSTLKPLHTLRRVIGDKVDNHRLAEDIIRTITIFGERTRISAKLKKEHSDELSDKEIESLSRLSFTGWGRLSSKLLTGLYDTCKETGERTNIIGMLESTNHNFMEILYGYSFNDQIKKHNNAMTSEQEVTYKSLDARYLSPAVKRGVWRTIAVVKDIIKCIGHPPKKVFIETTRDAKHKNAGKRVDSRKAQLMSLYKSCGEDQYWINLLDSKEEADLKQHSLYLYLTQLGKCMYCGKDIDINEINNTEFVNRDHIYPQSVTKDDSIHNNMVLTHTICNQKKSNIYPLSEDIRIGRKAMWDLLLSKGYITNEKYSRLIRSTQFTKDELEGFINRQMVETNQSVSVAKDILSKLLGDDTEIITVKSGIVTDFRDKFGLLKCRSVNDLHHAKDAYLNIVAGNVYNTKFKDVSRLIDTGEHYNLAEMYNKPVIRNGVSAWTLGKDGTEATVKKYMRRDNILFTKYPYIRKGQLFDENLVRPKKQLFERKVGMSVDKYGGYNSEKIACFSLIEYIDKKKTIKTIQPLPVRNLNLLQNINSLSEYYSKQIQKEVTVVVPVIKINSRLELDGFPVYVQNKFDDSRIRVTNGLQLLLPDSMYAYCKKIYKMVKDKKEQITKSATYYGLSAESNVQLYDVLRKKCNEPPYSTVFGKLYDSFESKRESFIQLEILEQASVLDEMLHIFQCNASKSDLTKINISGSPEEIRKSMRLSKEPIYLVNQSASGLVENRRKLN